MLRRWCSRYLNAITLSVHAGFLLAFLFEFDIAGHEVWQAFLFVSLLLSVYAWHFNFRRLLAIVEHPTSTIAAAAQGYVELKGRARQLLPMRSPLTQTPCVWFRYWVYVKDHQNVWRLGDYLSSEQPFELEDLTGRCVVDPTNAEVMLAERHDKTQHDHKYIELLIREGKPIYVLGELETTQVVGAFGLLDVLLDRLGIADGPRRAVDHRGGRRRPDGADVGCRGRSAGRAGLGRAPCVG